MVSGMRSPLACSRKNEELARFLLMGDARRLDNQLTYVETHVARVDNPVHRASASAQAL
jgi:hypothetical protein